MKSCFKTKYRGKIFFTSIDIEAKTISVYRDSLFSRFHQFDKYDEIGVCCFYVKTADAIVQEAKDFTKEKIQKYCDFAEEQKRDKKKRKNLKKGIDKLI